MKQGEKYQWLIPCEGAEELFRQGQERAKVGDNAGAFALLAQAVEEYPHIPDVHREMGLFMSWIDENETAIEMLEELRKSFPTWPMLMLTLQSVYAHADDLERVAELQYEMDMIIPEKLRDLKWHGRVNLAMLQVKRGLWREGFTNWEWEYPTQRRTVRQAGGIPPWKGTTNPDGTLALYWDQGYGDTMMYARFIEAAKERWRGKVVFDVQKPLHRWAKKWKGIDELVCTGEDHWLPEKASYKLGVTGLPYVLGVSTDAQVARNAVLCDVPAAHVPKDMLNVGLCWRGSDEFTINNERSMHFEDIKVLLGVPNVRYWSFQVGQYEQECDDPSVVRLAPKLKDFWDTCRYLKAMDLTISVDTSVINACGASGAKGWVLVWNPVEVRWGMPGERTGLWYPTITPYWRAPRQPWSEVLVRARQDLLQLSKMRSENT